MSSSKRNQRRVSFRNVKEIQFFDRDTSTNPDLLHDASPIKEKINDTLGSDSIFTPGRMTLSDASGHSCKNTTVEMFAEGEEVMKFQIQDEDDINDTAQIFNSFGEEANVGNNTAQLFGSFCQEENSEIQHENMANKTYRIFNENTNSLNKQQGTQDVINNTAQLCSFHSSFRQEETMANKTSRIFNENIGIDCIQQQESQDVINNTAQLCSSFRQEETIANKTSCIFNENINIVCIQQQEPRDVINNYQLPQDDSFDEEANIGNNTAQLFGSFREENSRIQHEDMVNKTSHIFNEDNGAVCIQQQESQDVINNTAQLCSSFRQEETMANKTSRIFNENIGTDCIQQQESHRDVINNTAQHCSSFLQEEAMVNKTSSIFNEYIGTVCIQQQESKDVINNYQLPQDDFFDEEANIGNNTAQLFGSFREENSRIQHEDMVNKTSRMLNEDTSTSTDYIQQQEAQDVINKQPPQEDPQMKKENERLFLEKKMRRLQEENEFILKKMKEADMIYQILIAAKKEKEMNQKLIMERLRAYNMINNDLDSAMETED